MKEIPDSELVVSSREGSQEAYAELFHRYKHKLLNYIYGYVGNFTAAQELSQETFIRAFEHLDELRDDAKFSSWLFSIATNISRNFIAERKKEPGESMDRPINASASLTLADVVPDDRYRPDSQIEKQQLQEKIQRAIDSLAPHYREVLLLCDIEGFSYEEIARILRCKVGTIGSRLNEARKKFRAAFRKEKE